jgi:E3 ubiquitin-protein ligase MARCH6
LSFDIVLVGLWITRNVLRAIRIVTDPLIDVTLEITRDVILKPALSSAIAVQDIVANKAGLRLPPSAPIFHSLNNFIPSTSGNSTLLADISTRIATGLKKGYVIDRDFSQRLASLRTVSGRVYTILLGYGVGALTVVLSFVASEMRLISWNIINGDIKQYILFGKLASFMIVELVVFPLGIGGVLELCLIPLIQGGTLSGMANVWKDRPFGGIFLAWLVGTM